jgi:hypothetical protein
MLAFLIFTGIAFGQSKVEVDQRLLENHGERIYVIYEKQKSYYDFLVWELNYGYSIVDMTEINPNEVSILDVDNIVNSNEEVFNIALLESPKLFNFISYNFIRLKNESAYYNLGNGQVMVFMSLTEVWNEYRKSK